MATKANTTKPEPRLLEEVYKCANAYSYAELWFMEEFRRNENTLVGKVLLANARVMRRKAAKCMAFAGMVSEVYGNKA